MSFNKGDIAVIVSGTRWDGGPSSLWKPPDPGDAELRHQYPDSEENPYHYLKPGTRVRIEAVNGGEGYTVRAVNPHPTVWTQKRPKPDDCQYVFAEHLAPLPPDITDVRAIEDFLTDPIDMDEAEHYLSATPTQKGKE